METPTGIAFEQRSSFGCDDLAVARARRYVRSTLDGVVDAAVQDAAVLVVSEFATNAVRHAGSAFEVVVQVGSHVRIEVADTSADLPLPRIGADRGGRGLHIVGALARRWGATPEPTGKRVWAELDY